MRRFVGLVNALAGPLRRDERGSIMAEYGLLAMLIAIVVVPVLILLGPLVAGLFTGVVGGP